MSPHDVFARAYSVVHLKSVSEEQRLITGTATSPRPDRLSDIIEPLGCKYSNPLPLLLQHDAHMPVGRVELDPPTASGIRFRAKLPKIDRAGQLRDRVDLAWDSVRHGLIGGASIGFRSINHEPMSTGGIRYKAVEILELSLVTCPANADAVIETVRAIARGQSSLLPAPKISRPGFHPGAVYIIGREPSKIDRATGQRHSVRYR